MFIIRTGLPYYLLVLNALSKDIPKQQIINVGKNIEVAVDKVRYAPVFGAYYLVITEYQKGQAYWKIIKQLYQKSYIELVITVHTKEQFRNLITKSEDSKFKFKIYDSYSASKRDRNIYIVQMMKSYNPDVVLSNAVLDAIRERLRGYSYEINGYLQQLAWTELTVKNVQKIIPKKDILTTASFGWLLYTGGISVAEADLFIMKYKYYPQALKESLLKYNNKLLAVLPYYTSGEFTEYNYEKFCIDNKKIVPSKFVGQTYLDIFKVMSIEKFYLIDDMLSKIGTESRYNDILLLYKIIRLVRGEMC